MPSHYLHLILSHQKLAETNIPDECRSAFLLGAVAPDAVAAHRDKKRTHYTIHVGITWGYRFAIFEQEFAGYRKRSVMHQRFYEGYKYHLLLDDAWMRECLHRALFRLAIRTLTGKANGGAAQYYNEMAQFNAFHRSSVAPEVLQEVYTCLAQADLSLLPEFLERDALGEMLKRLSDEMSQTVAHFDGQLVRVKEVKRFLHRVSGIPLE